MDSLPEALLVRVPAAENFEMMGAEFVRDERLDDLAHALIAKWPELRWLDRWRVKVLWKRKGGKSAGDPTLGRMTLASGLLKYFSDTDFIVWLGADHCRDREFQPYQIEALLFHELLHCAVKPGEDEEDDKPTAKGHDAELFVGEIERYGAWMDNLKVVELAFRQDRLPGFDVETGEIVGAGR